MKSPRRDLGGPADTWQLVLLGELVRALDAPVRVAPDPLQKLPKTGRWQRGLAQVRPAMDDALGATAFSVAWRWGCAALDRNAWPGAELVCAKATDRAVTIVANLKHLAETDAHRIDGHAGDRSWVLEGVATIGVSGDVGAIDWTEVDRVADMVSAWLDVPWHVETAGRASTG